MTWSECIKHSEETGHTQFEGDASKDEWHCTGCVGYATPEKPEGRYK